MTPSNERKSTLMLVISMLIFGSIGIFRRYIPFSSAFLTCFRGIAGGIFILIFMLIRHKKNSGKLPVKTVILLIISGAVMGANWMLLFEAYNYASVATATLCYYMEPTIVMLLAPLFFKEKLNLKKAICAIVSIVGMVLVSGITDGSTAGTSVKGVALGLGAAALYSAVVIMNKFIAGVDKYLKTTIQLLSAGLVMVPNLLITGDYKVANPGIMQIFLLIAVGLIHTGIAYVLYFGSMDGLKAQSIAILSYIDPVSALIFSAIILKEKMTVAGVIGAVLIIGAALICEINFKSKREMR